MQSAFVLIDEEFEMAQVIHAEQSVERGAIQFADDTYFDVLDDHVIEGEALQGYDGRLNPPPGGAEPG